MPLTLLAVAVGGAVGTLLRVLADLALPEAGLPWSTVAVNMIGSFALGAIIGGLGGRDRWPEWLREGAQTGLLGGFTTYSALALWGASAADLPLPVSALLVVLTAAVGVGVAYAGWAVGSRTAAKGAT